MRTNSARKAPERTKGILVKVELQDNASHTYQRPGPCFVFAFTHEHKNVNPHRKPVQCCTGLTFVFLLKLRAVGCCSKPIISNFGSFFDYYIQKYVYVLQHVYLGERKHIQACSTVDMFVSFTMFLFSVSTLKSNLC